LREANANGFGDVSGSGLNRDRKIICFVLAFSVVPDATATGDRTGG